MFDAVRKSGFLKVKFKEKTTKEEISVILNLYDPLKHFQQMLEISVCA